MKKKVWIIILLLIVFFIGVFINSYESFYKRIKIENHNASIKVLNSFEITDNSGDSLILFDKTTGITINARGLADGFWQSGELYGIMDEYIRLISAMNYDANVDDVTLNTKTIDGEDVGIVTITIDRTSKAFKTVSILTKNHDGYLVIEIYGSPEIMKEKANEVEKIVNSLKFGEN